MFKNIVICVISLVVSLVILELFLARWPVLARLDLKIEAIGVEPKCYANCYTSNPNGYFPLKIVAPLKALRKDIQGDGETTLYCIPYACQQRKIGFFSDRKDEIFLLGDSFTFGEGVKEADTLGYLLGQKFHEFNFRNFGETAADARRVSQIFNALLSNPKEQVKRVIYFYNLNDIAMSKDIAAKQKYIIDFENLRWGNVDEGNSGWDMFFSRLVLWRFIKKVFILFNESRMTIDNYLAMYMGENNKTQADETINDIVNMNKIARDRNISFTIVIYPLLYKKLWGKYPFLPIHQKLLSICVANGINCIDGYTAFSKHYSLKSFIVHPVDFHPNGLANQEMVNYLDYKRKQWLE